MIKKILRWILPFLIWLLYGMYIWIIIEIFFDSDNILVEHIIQILFLTVGAFLFVWTAYLLEPTNKLKAAKVNAIIICLIHFFITMADKTNILYNMPHYLGFVVAIVTYFVLRRVENRKAKQINLG